MIDTRQFLNLELPGGFIIERLELTDRPILDALQREAVARTRIVGRKLYLELRADMSEKEVSISLYHEIIEAASVGSSNPPVTVVDFNEASFEQAATEAFEQWGSVTPENLIRLLQFYDFQGEWSHGG